jgi:hypothetical protein
VLLDQTMNQSLVLTDIPRASKDSQIKQNVRNAKSELSAKMARSSHAPQDATVKQDQTLIAATTVHWALSVQVLLLGHVLQVTLTMTRLDQLQAAVPASMENTKMNTVNQLATNSALKDFTVSPVLRVNIHLA